MLNENKGNIIVSVIIVLLVVGFLIYITVNKKYITDNTLAGAVVVGEINTDENQNMPKTQQIEGVIITILKEGIGNVAKSGDTVAMNYTGKFTDGKVFDSNVGLNQPLVFTIGAEMVIKGWDIGIAGMKVGEKRNLVIQSDYAYGERGAGGIIPPNTTLVFDVELLAIKE